MVMMLKRKNEKKPERKEEKKQERRMRPTEWAKEDGIDHHLFLLWEKDLMTKNEYKDIKKKVYRER